ncbi:LysR substrate-binding domain-containing protein [Acidithiobacillus sp. IBUN Pt1247-S3]|uniref:LysR substrate-binding domain-containing protein n=1 Tax=Acidithiobacillus sp. IBUN Pt1247-S3 TaxID=3166642 RepID=UPI0034E4F4EF
MALDAEQLLTFLVLAETGSVSETARRSHRGQPAISERLRKLNESVGEPLYVHENGKLRLTEMGLALLPEIQRLRTNMQVLEDFVRKKQNLELGTLRLASTSLIVNYHLPHILHQFRQKYPHINLLIHSGERYWQGLLAEKVDGIFFENGAEAPQLPTSYEVYLWRNDDILAVLPLDHPLSHQPVISLEQLRDYPLVWREPSSGTRRILEKALLAKDIQPAHFIEVVDVESVGALVEAGLGIGFMPRSVIDRRQDWRLQKMPLAANLVLETYLAVPPDGQRSRVLRAFLDLLQISTKQQEAIPRMA